MTEKKSKKEKTLSDKFNSFIDGISISQINTFVLFMVPVSLMVFLTTLIAAIVIPVPETESVSNTKIEKSSGTITDKVQVCPNEWIITYERESEQRREYFILNNEILDADTIDFDYLINDCNMTPNILDSSNPGIIEGN